MNLESNIIQWLYVVDGHYGDSSFYLMRGDKNPLHFFLFKRLVFLKELKSHFIDDHYLPEGKGAQYYGKSYNK